ncbi:MAG: ACP S-malonyltransferase [Lachnospiraceae bacterium]|nr:ACP S-malonyltransferase [Lachnospiraceae bacterium]
MGKIAFIFPGQGAQYVGMAKDFYDAIPLCKEVFEKASSASALDVEKLCFEENDQINITEYTQIAMVAAEVAMLRALEAKGVKPDVTAGLSLGEYGALVASGVMSEEDVFKVVRKRGIYMQEAVPTGGAMVAVLGLDTKVIEEVCDSVDGQVTIANYNCPGQIVITGEEKAVATAAEKLAEAGAKRCVSLKVSGPFHSPLLAGAGEKLGKELEDVAINDIAIPYIANVTADYVASKDDVKALLEKQVSASVRWQQTVERMIADGVTTFIEIGPGKTLSGFMRKINRDVQVLNVEKVEDLDKVVEALQ